MGLGEDETMGGMCMAVFTSICSRSAVREIATVVNENRAEDTPAYEQNR